MNRALGPALILAAFAAAACSRQGKIDRIRENGVEVVLNHREPYKKAGRPSTFELKRLYSIDTEDEALAKAGMGSAGEYGVDGSGSVTIVAFKNKRDFIYRFDPQGRLIRSFGRNGQGPGEIEWPFLDRVFDDGRIAITDRMHKYIVYDRDGKVVREIRPGFSFGYVDPLDDGRLIVLIPHYGAGAGGSLVHPVSLSLCRADFEKIKELDRHQYPPDGGNEKLMPFFAWRVSAGHIYVANQERGYEILDYDLAGSLQRKIRKEYTPVRPTREIRKAFLGSAVDQPGVAHYLPDPLPPVAAIFTDDEGRLFAMSYEAGDKPGEYLWDIFDPDGVFIGRKSLEVPSWRGLNNGSRYTMIKNGLLYDYAEKESGYRELVISAVIWR
jgi:hypothetical protein